MSEPIEAAVVNVFVDVLFFLILWQVHSYEVAACCRL